MNYIYIYLILLIIEVLILKYLLYSTYITETFIYDKKNFNLSDDDEYYKLGACKKTKNCVTYTNNNTTIIKEDKAYLFIHIPKNAGTFVRKFLPGLNGPHDHLPLSEIKETFPELVKKNHTFVIIRNPWERCVSMYNFHVNSSNMDIKSWGYYGMEILDKHNVKTFEDFVRLLYDNRNNIINLGEIVWEKQVYFIKDNKGNILVDQIIRMENLDKELQILKSKFKIKLNIPKNKINVSNSNHYHEYYTPKIKEMVDEIFKEDIAFTGYKY